MRAWPPLQAASLVRWSSAVSSTARGLRSRSGSTARSAGACVVGRFPYWRDGNRTGTSPPGGELEPHPAGGRRFSSQAGPNQQQPGSGWHRLLARSYPKERAGMNEVIEGWVHGELPGPEGPIEVVRSPREDMRPWSRLAMNPPNLCLHTTEGGPDLGERYKTWEFPPNFACGDSKIVQLFPLGFASKAVDTKDAFLLQIEMAWTVGGKTRHQRVPPRRIDVVPDRRARRVPPQSRAHHDGPRAAERRTGRWLSTRAHRRAMTTTGETTARGRSRASTGMSRFRTTNIGIQGASTTRSSSRWS